MKGDNCIGGFDDEDPEATDVEGALQDEIEELAAALLINGPRGDDVKAIANQAFELAAEFIAQREQRRCVNERELSG